MTEPGPAPDDDVTLAFILESAEARLFGAGRRYSPAELWELAGVPESLARQLWLAMGFPSIPDDEQVLTDRDLQALHRAGELLHAGTFGPEQLVTQTRLMGQALSTIATAHVETLGSSGSPQGLLAELTERDEADPLLVLDELLSYLYRRHLLAALERATLAAEPPGDALPRTVVGFADLTNFSATAAAATERELTILVDDFVALATDLVASAGGRVIKLIGDEVMFSVDQPPRAATVALDLIEMAGDPGLPPVHVGLAAGPVLSHHGDLFGSTVNTASRLSDAARAGTVLVNGALAEALAGVDGVETRRVHLRALKGIGHVPAYVLRRAGG